MNSSHPRLAIIDGVRTPFCKAGGTFKALQADDLGAIASKALLERVAIPLADIDELICGNVAQPIHAANIARVIARLAGLPTSTPAYTVHRNCASGMEAISSAACKIIAGEITVALCCGTESMSNIPLIYGAEMSEWFLRLSKSRSLWQKLGTLAAFRPRFLKPVIGIQQGLTDPVCGLNMGQTAEVLAKEFRIPREEQDAFALQSHQRACAATEAGRLQEEIVPVPLPPGYQRVQEIDDGPRAEQSMPALGKLRPYFDRATGSVTVGNACPVTDGAAATLVMSETEAQRRGLEPLGFVRDYAYAALDGARMGLGPVYATSKLCERGGYTLDDFELIEINEAFAAQVLACLKAFASDDFARDELGRERALGTIDQERLNVNGGAVALGHPVGTTGTRLVITLLKELRRRGATRGLASLCVGGGQGAAFVLETT